MILKKKRKEKTLKLNLYFTAPIKLTATTEEGKWQGRGWKEEKKNPKESTEQVKT